MNSAEFSMHLQIVQQANQKRKAFLCKRGAVLSEKCEKCEKEKIVAGAYTFCEDCFREEAGNTWREHVRLYEEMTHHEPKGQFFCCHCAEFCDLGDVVQCKDCTHGKWCQRCQKNKIFSCVFKK